jgi:hypothetical protein
MNPNETTVEDAALKWFKEMGCVPTRDRAGHPPGCNLDETKVLAPASAAASGGT